MHRMGARLWARATLPRHRAAQADHAIVISGNEQSSGGGEGRGLGVSLYLLERASLLAGHGIAKRDLVAGDGQCLAIRRDRDRLQAPS